MSFANLFKPKIPEKEKHALSEVDLLGRRIQLLTLMIDDFKSDSHKYQQAIDGPVNEGYQALVIERTKLEIQHLYLTKFF